jgi:hypothetical protein
LEKYSCNVALTVAVGAPQVPRMYQPCPDAV